MKTVRLFGDDDEQEVRPIWWSNFVLTNKLKTSSIDHTNLYLKDCNAVFRVDTSKMTSIMDLATGFWILPQTKITLRLCLSGHEFRRSNIEFSLVGLKWTYLSGIVGS